MMGIYIPNSEFYKSCGSCTFSVRKHTSLGEIIDCRFIGTVGAAFDDKFDILNKRHPDCPVKEIPLPHGRLIDADGLKKDILHHLAIKNESFLLAAEREVFKKIDQSPTVIEPENQEEE